MHYFKNKYLLTILFFLVWMLFFDQNNFWEQRKLTKELVQLKLQKEYYGKQIVVLQDQKKQLTGNMNNLEKLAREKYFMKKEGETIYLIEE